MNQSNKFQNFLSFKKLLTIALITSVGWQTFAYGANIGASIIYTYLLIIILFHIPNLFLTNYLFKTHDNHNLIYLVNSRLNNFSAILLNCCSWLSNVVGYPAAFTFILANLGYAFNYQLSTHEYFAYSIMLYALLSFINARGFKAGFSSMLIISILSVTLPLLVILAYSGYYVWINYDAVKVWFLHTQIHGSNFNLKDINLGFVSALIISVIGFEQLSLHSEEIIKHKFKFGKLHFALLSVIVIAIILFTIEIFAYISSLRNLNPNYLVADMIIAFFTLFHHPEWSKVFIVLFSIAETGGLFAWMVHINRGFNASLLLSKSSRLKSFGNNYTPLKLIKFELVVFLLYFVLLQILPVLQTSVFLYNLSSQLTMLYYIIIYLAVIRDKSLSGNLKVIFIIGFSACVLGVICSIIPNMSMLDLIHWK